MFNYWELNGLPVLKPMILWNDILRDVNIVSIAAESRSFKKNNFILVINILP